MKKSTSIINRPSKPVAFRTSNLCDHVLFLLVGDSYSLGVILFVRSLVRQQAGQVRTSESESEQESDRSAVSYSKTDGCLERESVGKERAKERKRQRRREEEGAVGEDRGAKVGERQREREECKKKRKRKKRYLIIVVIMISLLLSSTNS